MAGARGIPESRYFRLEQLADGIFAAIVVPGTGAWGNAGIVHLGDAALVFDTFLTLAPARELRAAAEALTGAPVRYVVNSHYHMDHTYGNTEFPDAVVIATATTRDLIAQRSGGLLERVQADTHPESGFLSQFEVAMRAEPDDARRADMAMELSEWRILHGAAPHMTLRLPDVTFAERLVLHGSQRRAELLSYGGGHTPSDAFLYLPGERIAFMGDLVPVRTHPSFAGDAAEWLRILERVEQLDIATLVPGHGQVGSLADCTTTRRYIGELWALASAVARAGGTADEAAAVPVPAAYASWAAPTAYPETMRFLYRQSATASEQEDG
jgi:glyoxylase-like metal-dependent hydrolase (beta-lactamase superfamily II)